MPDHILDDEREALRLAGAANGIVPRLIGRLVELRSKPCRIVGRTTMHCATCEAAIAAEQARCEALVLAPAASWGEYSDTRQLLLRIAARIRSGAT